MGSTIVIAAYPLLKASGAAAPRIQLVMAYAYVAKGEYMSAAGHLARAMLGKESLSALDQHFLAALQNGCRYRVGQITDAEYVANEKALAAHVLRSWLSSMNWKHAASNILKSAAAGREPFFGALLAKPWRRSSPTTGHLAP